MSSNYPSSCSLFAVLMAGGPGARLWPESRRKRPKPFLPLTPSGRSLFRATLDRLDGLVPVENRFVVAGRDLEKILFEEAPETPRNRALLEPVGRDTALCVAWGALEALRLHPDPTLVVLPSDHLIEPDEAFRQTIRRAKRLVDADPKRLVTLGVVPREPSNAYGYVERGEKLGDEEANAYEVVSFREKPDVETAKRFLLSGRFFWNAGVFVWKARRIIELIGQYEPELGASIRELGEAIDEAKRLGLRSDESTRFQRVYANAKRISIDYAALERAPCVVTLSTDDFLWNDVGSFAALEKITKEYEDVASNAALGAEIVAENARNNYARIVDSTKKTSTKDKKTIAFVDVEDLLVVDVGDVLLIAKKGNDASIKKMVERLKSEGKENLL